MTIGGALRGRVSAVQGFQPAPSAGTESAHAAAERGKTHHPGYALSVAASLSVIALVGWIAFFNHPLTARPEIAKAPNTPPLAAAPSTQLASVPSDATMNEYLIAHQEFSSRTAILGLAPYIRSVSGAQPGEGCQ